MSILARYCFALLSLALAFASVGCITLGKPADEAFLPDYEVITGTVRPGTGPTVVVTSTRSSRALEETDKFMMVRGSGPLVEERRLTQWLVTPADLVRDQLLEHLLASDRIGYAALEGDADLRVIPVLRRFDEEHQGDSWFAVFAVDLEIQGKSHAPVAYVRLPPVRRAAPTPTPAGVAEAMRAAMREGLTAAAEAVAAHQR
jgi:hypothetical protein